MKHPRWECLTVNQDVSRSIRENGANFKTAPADPATTTVNAEHPQEDNDMAKQGNGLGEDNAKSWNPKSVGGYSRGLQAPKTGKVADEKRKGPGQKA